MSFAYFIHRLALLIMGKILFRLESIDWGKIPKTGGALIVANHASYLDPLLIGCAIKKRQATFMAKRELFNLPLVGGFVRIFSFPVDKDSTKPSTIKDTVKHLKKGELVVLFPEGGRSANGDLLSPKRGAAVIASLAKAPIIPAYIDGTYRAFPVGSKFPKPVKVKVIFGDKININEDVNESNKDSHEKIGIKIMEAIKNLSCKLADK
ncbi:MAG: 1-acyl-sn-glycerol-3-phosphate acyltransferase [Nitrospiraceae bacterium]|nr:1-acyl-sn-glycerol-3-phosphate acyltransferase [Nitrospiraceae bacterium]